ncbi:MAG: ABC transporter ATP-binding protein/permease [Treponema sp.]|jgi:ATP-binding cassette subfamily B protein|nr:ABC transporter ATP-binding protein/permease [Treponema sp.]
MTEKTKTAQDIIIGVLKQHRAVTLLLVSVAVCSAIAGLVPPLILRFIIDRFLTVSGSRTGLSAAAQKSGLVYAAVLYFLSFAVIGLLDVLRETILAVAGQKIVVTFRTTMMDKLFHLPVQYFTKHENGSVVSRFTNDVDSVQNLFTNGVVGMIMDLFRIIGIVISMWSFSVALGIFMAAILPLVYLLTRFFQRHMLKAQKEKRHIIAGLNGFVPETVRNIAMIHSFSKERYMQKKYAGSLKKSYDTIEKVNWYDSVYSPIIRVLSSLVVATVAVAASTRFSFVLISAGTTAAAIQYVLNVFTPIGNLGMELQSIQSAVAGIVRINEFLAEDEENDRKKISDTALLTLIREKKSIEFDNVTFAYDEKAEILHDVSFRIEPDEKILLQGRTGAGKSTMLRLIAGLLAPSAGNVRISGIDSCRIPHRFGRRIFGYVPQQFSFVPGTVRDQITLGDRLITDAQVERALLCTGQLDSLKLLKNGLETPADPTLFSQGQLQLLSIARAVVADPLILLFDEITAHLDVATEKRLAAALREAGKNRTVISVSHRLSSGLQYDRVADVCDGLLYWRE